MLVVFLLPLISFATGAVDLCNKKCGEKESDDICTNTGCDTLIGNCCWKNGAIMIDLRNCGLLDLEANTFLREVVLENQTHSIERICINNNDLSPKNVSRDAFRGLTGLKTIVVPKLYAECPGGNKYWEHPLNTSLVCEGQKTSCNISGEICPDKSHCVSDGPGLMRCRCNEGYYGYKCLKSGQFPYAIFYGCLGAATVVISGVLWYVGRRKIGSHTKQS